MQKEDLSFPRKLRLTKSSEFKNLFSKSCKTGDRYFTMLFRPNNLGYPRLGLAVSKKSVRRAVGRNKLKRLIREAFRLRQQSLCGFDMVVLVGKGAGRGDSIKLSQSLHKHFETIAASQCDD